MSAHLYAANDYHFGRRCDLSWCFPRLPNAIKLASNHCNIFNSSTYFYASYILYFNPLVIPTLFRNFFEEVRRQQLPLLEIPKRLILFILISDNPPFTQFLTNFIGGEITLLMQIIFLEAFWQACGASRTKTYASSVLAATVSGLVVSLGIEPLRDFVVYIAG